VKAALLEQVLEFRRAALAAGGAGVEHRQPAAHDLDDDVEVRVTEYVVELFAPRTALPPPASPSTSPGDSRCERLDAKPEGGEQTRRS